MRFASIPQRKPQERTPAADFIRRLVVPETAARIPPAKVADLPRDLDQRVRLVGEW